MSELESDFNHGRRAVAVIRREIWPEHGGNFPDDGASPDEINRYIEALESAVAGSAMAARMIARGLKP